MICVRPLSTTPRVLASWANAVAAKASGSAAAITRVDKRFMSLHLFPGGGIIGKPTHCQREQLLYREYFSRRRRLCRTNFPRSENVLVTTYRVFAVFDFA